MSGAALAALAPVLWPAPFPLSDHLIFVEAGRLVLEGRSPYEGAAWTAIAREVGSPHIATLAATTGVWPHPPWTAYAFVPFALLPRDVAPWALHLVLLGSGVAGVVLGARALHTGDLRLDALALAVGLTFQPLVIGIRWGQLAPLLLLGLAAVIVGLRSGRSVPIVAGALLLALKPHVVVLVAVVAAYLVVRRVPRAAVPSTLALGIPAGLALLRHPDWLGAAGAGYAARIEAFPTYASTYAFAIDVAGGAWPVVAVLCVALTLGAGMLAIRAAGSTDPAWPLAAAAIASVAVVPYVWPYDHAVLLPVALLSIAAAARLAGTVRAMHLGLTVLVFTGLPWLLFLASAPRPTQAAGALLPLAAAGVLLLAARRAGSSAAR